MAIVKPKRGRPRKTTGFAQVEKVKSSPKNPRKPYGPRRSKDELTDQNFRDYVGAMIVSGGVLSNAFISEKREVERGVINGQSGAIVSGLLFEKSDEREESSEESEEKKNPFLVVRVGTATVAMFYVASSDVREWLSSSA